MGLSDTFMSNTGLSQTGYSKSDGLLGRPVSNKVSRPATATRLTYQMPPELLSPMTTFTSTT